MLRQFCYVNTRVNFNPKELILCSAAGCHTNGVFVQFKIHFSHSVLNAQFLTIHVHLYSKHSFAKTAIVIVLGSFRKRSYYSSFKTRSSVVLKVMESIYVPLLINPSKFNLQLLMKFFFSILFLMLTSLLILLLSCVSCLVAM